MEWTGYGPAKKRLIYGWDRLGALEVWRRRPCATLRVVLRELKPHFNLTFAVGRFILPLADRRSAVGIEREDRFVLPRGDRRRSRRTDPRRIIERVNRDRPFEAVLTFRDEPRPGYSSCAPIPDTQAAR